MNDVDALDARKAALLQMAARIVNFRVCEEACRRAGEHERAAIYRGALVILRQAHQAEMFDPEPAR
jgi:hypothetical protein